MPRPMEHPCDFDPVEHAYYDVHGRVHRSITQILADSDCVDYSMVDGDVLQACADRGTRVHHATAMWDKLRGLLPLGEFLRDYNVDLDIHRHLRHYERFLAEMLFRADDRETERPRLVSIQGVIVGMTPDRVGHFPRPLGRRGKIDYSSTATSVLDIKTGIVQPSHPLQVAGYSMGLESSLRLAMMHHRYALYLTEDDYRLVRHTHQQDYYAMIDAIRGGGPYLEDWKKNQQRILV